MLSFLSSIFAQGLVTDKPNQFWELEIIYTNIIRVIIPFAGIVLFVVLMLGGIKWITAGSNPKSLESAKNTITYGIVGLIILAMAYMILVLIEVVTGANVTTFKLFFG